MNITKLIRKFSKINDFKTFKEFKNHMDNSKPELCLMYFKSNWNPKFYL